jgi:hypothetical protein
MTGRSNVTEIEAQVRHGNDSVPDARVNARRRDGFLWIVVVVGIVVILGVTSCVIGYVVLPPILAPTPTPTPPTGTKVRNLSVDEIRRLAELSTVKYSLTAEVSDVSVPDDFRQQLGVKEEILLLAYGEVAAGFDLNKLQDRDIWVDGTRVQVHLPAPEVLYSRLDTERTRVIYYKKTVFVRHDISQEARVRAEAEKAIRDAALESDILDRASDYGQLFFSNWLYSLGFTEVRVIVG